MDHLKITLLRDAEAIDDARRQANPNSRDAIKANVASHSVLDPFEQELAVNRAFTPRNSSPRVRLPDHLFRNLSREKRSVWLKLDDPSRELCMDFQRQPTPSTQKAMISNQDSIADRCHTGVICHLFHYRFRTGRNSSIQVSFQIQRWKTSPEAFRYASCFTFKITG